MKIEYLETKTYKKRNASLRLNEKITYNTLRGISPQTPDPLWIYFFEEGNSKYLLISDIQGDEETKSLRPDAIAYNGYLDDCQSLEDIEEKAKWVMI